MLCLASVGCIMLWWRLAYATRERKRICPIYPHAGNLRFMLTQYFHSCLLLHASWFTRIHACIHALTDIIYSISSIRQLPECDSDEKRKQIWRVTVGGWAKTSHQQFGISNPASCRRCSKCRPSFLFIARSTMSEPASELNTVSFRIVHLFKSLQERPALNPVHHD